MMGSRQGLGMGSLQEDAYMVMSVDVIETGVCLRKKEDPDTEKGEELEQTLW